METKLVVPGEKLFDVPKRGKNFYEEDGKTYSAAVGLFDGMKVVSLKGGYEPELGDVVIGIVTYVRFNGYDVNVNLPYDSFLLGKETKTELVPGSIISARIKEVDEVKNVDLADGRDLRGGKIIEASPVKVPRIIGKKMSMLNLIREKTQCDILVGKNGRVWVKGKNTPMVVKAINKIEKEAHTHGLTERISELLSST